MSYEIKYNVFYQNSGVILIDNLTMPQHIELLQYLEKEKDTISLPKSTVKIVDKEDLLVVIIASSKKIKVSKNNLDNYYELLKNVISNIEDSVQRVKDDTRRILHNVVSLNTINNQEFDSIFSPEELDGLSHKKMIGYMSTVIKNQSSQAARSILKINKNNNEIKYELDVFKYLINPDSELRKSKQNIHRVTKRILDTFFIDFLDKNINIELKTNNDELIEHELNFDCLRYAIYNIFDNALKYCKPDSDIYVDISKTDQKISIEFNMISLYISPSEIDRIFIEGYSGESAKIQNLNGDGIGLYMTKRVLERISAKIFLKQREQHTYNNTIYQRNIFYIEIAVEN